ncbi:hypothetical protein D3C78_1976320 [compost metagenome]
MITSPMKGRSIIRCNRPLPPDPKVVVVMPVLEQARVAVCRLLTAVSGTGM